ncbi:MAG: ATP-dependent serine protease [Bacteroidales bacterium]|nr:ATP-dependent serine protease [Bacteroidales bacterium]
MGQALSVTKVLNAKFHTLEFDGEWLAAVGQPELTGSWMVYGAPKNGKTTFAMMLAKYLSKFVRVAYDSVEEGLSQSIQMSMERVGMKEVGGRVVLLDKEPFGDLVKRLHRQKSPDVVIIDSVQFMGLTFDEYKRLKTAFPDKLFVYVSHVAGRQPEGQVAKRIWRDANVYFRIEGYRAFPVSRYEGGTPIDVWKERAEEYWGLEES